jgi:gamma-glutamyltranspeptidase/glutathione hydrolase
MDPFDYSSSYASRRSPVLARNVVATSQPLAAQAGLRMLLAGGNAVDAALAAAVTLTVVEPTSNGIGSDAFAIVWDGQKLHGLNASGRSPLAWTTQQFSGMREMPLRGWMSVTTPGAVSGWVELSRRFGRLPFAQLFEPAIDYARNGFAVSPIIAESWQRSIATFGEFPEFLRTFAAGGRGPDVGQTVRLPDHARTLTEIAQSTGESFYRGELARRIVAHAQSSGGLISLDDLACHRADWVEPLSCDYQDVTLHEIPPNGQGIAALLALKILSSFKLRELKSDSADAVHLQIEAMKLALADARGCVADPQHMNVAACDLLDMRHANDRARLIDPGRANVAAAGIPRRGGTVYLAAADASEMMVSFIQSNYWGFGSGNVIPGTGIAMQNRGHGFTLEPGHPNEVGPGKRPFHTIIPAFVTRGGQPLMSFGVMGGIMQAQGHVQMMTRTFDHHQNPQAASDAPRWRVDGGLNVSLERGFAPDVLDDLRQRGHHLRFAEPGEFGGAQLIYKLDDGYLGASDHRKDGQAVGY